MPKAFLRTQLKRIEIPLNAYQRLHQVLDG